MPDFWRDCRYAFRSLSRLPVLSATIVLTVGIGLGATTAMLAIVKAVLLDPLPYADSGSLVWIYTDARPYRFRLSVVDYRALEADHSMFSALAAYQGADVTVTDGEATERVYAKEVTGSYFPLLGQQPQLGRLFGPSDDARDNRTAVLSYEYWMRRFGGDRGILGRGITIDGERYTIAGVLQRSVGPLERDVALFRVAHWPPPQRRGPFFTMVLARVRPDVTRAAALESLHAANKRLFPIWRSSYQAEDATWGIQDLAARVVGDVGSTLMFVLIAVACVLLIACANAINLLVARGLHRSRELAIRGALGASRGRLLQQVGIEAAVLTAGAAIVGGGVAVVALRLVAAYGGDYIPRLDEVRLSGVVLAWMAGLAVASGLLLGAVPAWQSTRLRIERALQSGGRGATDGPAARRVRRLLVAAEFALATPLLVAAALVLASLHQLTQVPVGIATDALLTGELALPDGRYPNEADREAFWKRAQLRLSGLPGVAAAAVADSRPPEDAGNLNNFDLEDRPALNGKQPVCTWVGVTPAFFKTAGLTLERGRLLDDRSLQENVVVVDRAWANRFFPGEEVIGRRFREGGCTTCEWTTVVGLVSDMKWMGLDAPENGTVYAPFVNQSNGFVILRSTGDPLALASSLRQALRELDPGLALANVSSGDELVSHALATPRYLSVLIGGFGLTALVLSVVGIYGVMAFFVQQHTRDIGIRLALGSDPARTRRMIVVQGLRLVGIGVAVGVAAAYFASRLLATSLYGISATDARAMAGVPAALLAAAIIACLVPAYRAGRLDPAEVLREG